jgi:hypothetical protein
MTQYDNEVQRQIARVAAEEWANGVKSLHVHSLDSLWYGIGRSDGSVTDIEYNDGRVQRTINATNKVVWLNKENVVSGDELITAFERGGI